MTAIYSFLDNYDGIKPEDRILEPSAGTGNVVKALRNRGYENRIDSVEINPSRKEVLEECSDSVVIADFLELPVKQTYEVVLGNPPYSLAQEFVDKSLEFLVPGGHLIFLLRTCFLESQKRYRWWQERLPSGLYTLSKRPSFTGYGTDANSYSWFVWTKGEKVDSQTIKVIW